MEYDPEDPLCSHELQAYEKYFDAEPNFMAVEGYANSDKAKLRKKAIQMIAQHSNSEKFDAFIPYLAMNYFDRFVSRREIPKVRGTLRFDLELFALCCLTLAWKMRKKSFSVTKFLTERILNIDRRLVMKMELQILGELEWRMRSLTPLAFVQYFVPYFKLRDPQISEGFKRRNIDEIIIQTQGDITFTKFKPSIIAASSLLVASSVLYPRRFPRFKEKILSAPVVKKEALLECLEAMDKLCEEKRIAIEHPRIESTVASNSRAGFSKPLEAVGGGDEAPVISRREGKAPVGEIEEVPTVEESEVTVMNIKLDWVNPDDEDDDEPIDSPHFRKALYTVIAGRCGCCNPL